MEDFGKKADSLKRRLADARKGVFTTYEQGRKALSDDSVHSQFKGLFRTLDRYFSRYESLWDELCDLYAGEGKEADFPLKADNENNTKVHNYFIRSHEYYETLFGGTTAAPEASRRSITFTEAHSSKTLPTISLPKFDGRMTDWPKFRDTFTSLVHNEISLSSIQKFHYLVSSISGPAHTVICHLPMQEENYKIAWEALLNAYDNKRMLAAAYLNKLVNFKPIQGKPSVESLKAFLMMVSDNIAAFKLLSIQNEADFVLFHLAIKCLDPTTREQFELAHKQVEFPTFDILTKFIRDRCLAFQLAEGASSDPAPDKSRERTFKPPSSHRPAKTSLLADRPREKEPSLTHKPLSCVVCHEGAHKLLSCLKFSNATAKQRLQWLANWNGCRNCLSYNHKTTDCASRWHCRLCKARHHSMLHLESSNDKLRPIQSVAEPAEQTSTAGPSVENSTAKALNTITPQDCQVILGTSVAFIKDTRGIFQAVRLVVDSGSQCSFMTLKCLNRLGLPMSKYNKNISGIGQTLFEGAKGLVSCLIRPAKCDHPCLSTEAVIVKNISSRIPSVTLPACIKKELSGYELADPNFFKPADVDLLLGADLFAEVLTGPAITLGENLPKLFPSIFGHIVIGKCNIQNPMSAKQTSLFVSSSPCDLKHQLSRFWELEEPVQPIKGTSANDDMCEQHFLDTHTRNQDGRYIVRLPFKEPPCKLGDSKGIGLKRLLNLENKLEKNPDLKIQYHDFLHEYLKLDHMSPAKTDSRFIIPHHSVSKEDRNKLKIRVVFDASVKTSTNESLNDYLLAGPKLQTDIRDILLNFRSHAIVFVADVIKMYRNILLHENDRPYQHILWRFDSSSDVTTYELNTVTYGLTSAPYLALRVIQQLISDEGDKFPIAAKVIGRDMYIDDLATGSNTIPEALELQRQVIGLLKLGGFSLGKWASNSDDIMKVVSHQPDDDPVTVIFEDECSLKILGLQWKPKDDEFGYNIAAQPPSTTKRGVLSTIAKIFDPLGFLSPCTFLMKTFIQELWKEGLDWDQPMSNSLLKDWEKIIQQLPELSKVKIPRFICSPESYTYQVVGFADASTKGYCAVIYLRCITSTTIVSLLTAKTKLAPLKTVSVPRLELCAAAHLIKLYKSIKGFLSILSGSSQPPSFFTDSTIVLGWLNTEPYKLNTFIANRVAEITAEAPVTLWKHVASASNPSDCGSRGLLPEELIRHDLWWSGPPWLKKPQESWPDSSLEQFQDLPELKKKEVVLVTQASDASFFSWMSRFSSYDHLLRVTAWILRFANNCKNKIRCQGPLKLSEITAALELCVKTIQLHCIFKGDKGNQREVMKTYHKLSPFLDKSGILRVGGRLRYSVLPHDHKYPMLLPKKCHFTTLLVDSYHHRYFHPGPSLLQALIQQRFWIPSLRRLVQQRTFYCIKCYKLKAKTVNPIMGNLPSYRLTGGKAFHNVGIDFGGPFTMRESLRRKSPQSKVYLCLFVCLATKALHLELVTKLSTDAFLACLDRFVSRRGLPSCIYSDCGSNFVGASSHLKELLKWFNDESTKKKCVDYTVKHGIEWKFIPPHSPHFGGIWEAGIKSVKRLLRTTVGENPLTYEELLTYLTKIESILNSRPICPLSSDPGEMDYLTPGHFIIGGPLVAIPEPTLLDLKQNLLSRWQLVKRMSEDFWKRWRIEYLSTLQTRSKWTKQSKNVTIGDLVLMKEDFVPVSKWPLARISATHPGRDGIVRVVTVKTPTSTYRRSVVKIVPLLPLNSQPFEKD